MSKRDKRIHKDKRNHTPCEWIPNMVGLINYDAPKADKWDQLDEFRTVNLQHHLSEFRQIARRMHKTLEPYTKFDIIRIERIENPWLMAAFVIKHTQLHQQRPWMHVKTRSMFHATSRANTTAIIRNGFDWRLAGTNSGAKWGLGTSFSPYADFAGRFSHPERGEYCMLVCLVLDRQSMIGWKELDVPDDDCDSTTDLRENVLVKFDDFTAYPSYRITYRK